MIQALAILLLALAELALVIWAFIDAVRRPKAAWRRAGQHKLLWVVLQPVGLVFLIGMVIPIVYLVFVRPSVRRAEIAGG